MKRLIWNSQSGAITLFELIAVMAIIVTLAGFLAPSFMGTRQEARISEIATTAEALKRATERYYIDTGQWPTEDPATNTHDLFVNPFDPPDPLFTKWKGPYIDRPLRQGQLFPSNAVPFEGGVVEENEGSSLVIFDLDSTQAEAYDRVYDPIQPQAGENWWEVGEILWENVIPPN